MIGTHQEPKTIYVPEENSLQEWRQRMAAWDPDTPRFSSREKHWFHLRGIFGRIRADRKFIIIAVVSRCNSPGNGYCRECADAVYATYRRLDHAHVFYLYFCQYGYGDRYPARGGGTAAAHKLRGHIDGDNVAGIWYFDEHTDASQAGEDLRYGESLIPDQAG